MTDINKTTITQFNQQIEDAKIEVATTDPAGGMVSGDSSSAEGSIAVELDPIFIKSPAGSITEQDIVNWNNLSSGEDEVIFSNTAPANTEVIWINPDEQGVSWSVEISTSDIENWNEAYTTSINVENKLDNTFAVYKDVGNTSSPEPAINTQGDTVPQTAVFTRSHLEGSVRITQHLAKDHTGAEIVFYETKEIL